MTTDDSCSSSCWLPPPAQDLVQGDESSSDCIDYPVEPGIIGQHGKPVHGLILKFVFIIVIMVSLSRLSIMQIL